MNEWFKKRNQKRIESIIKNRGSLNGKCNAFDWTKNCPDEELLLYLSIGKLISRLINPR